VEVAQYGFQIEESMITVVDPQLNQKLNDKIKGSL
jgi:hypothetical protein